MKVPEDYIMGTSDKSCGCGGSFWFFVVSMITVTIGLFTGLSPIVLAVVGGITFLNVLIIVIIEIVEKRGKRMKIYVVTSGEYSDYHIVTVFSTQEKAESFAKARNDKIKHWYDDYYEVEVYDLDDTDNISVESGINYCPDVNIYGFVYTLDYKFEYCYLAKDRYRPFYCTAVIERDKRLKFDVCADSEEKARKIAQDRIAEYKYRKEVEEK